MGWLCDSRQIVLCYRFIGLLSVISSVLSGEIRRSPGQDMLLLQMRAAPNCGETLIFTEASGIILHPPRKQTAWDFRQTKVGDFSLVSTGSHTSPFPLDVHLLNLL